MYDTTHVNETKSWLLQRTAANRSSVESNLRHRNVKQIKIVKQPNLRFRLPQQFVISKLNFGPAHPPKKTYGPEVPKKMKSILFILWGHNFLNLFPKKNIGREVPNKMKSILFIIWGQFFFFSSTRSECKICFRWGPSPAC